MTFTDCWIEGIALDTPGTPSPRGARRGSASGYFLPSLPGGGHYWLPLLREWAEREGLEIEWIDPLWIRVSVSRVQMLGFLREVYGSGEYSAVADLQRRVEEHLVDGRTYTIQAEEF
jgi:hypothetical protein